MQLSDQNNAVAMTTYPDIAAVVVAAAPSVASFSVLLLFDLVSAVLTGADAKSPFGSSNTREMLSP